MIKSKFRLWILLPLLISFVLLIAAIIFLTRPYPVLNPDTPIFFKIIFPVFFIYFFLSMFWGEFRTKAISVYIDENSINKKGFAGFGTSDVFLISNLDGYVLSHVSSRSGTYEYLYIIQGGKKVVKLSEFYHLNYIELKNIILKLNIKYLGTESWSLIQETKEIFL